MKKLDSYWEMVQADVCANCIDRNQAGTCSLSGEFECGLKRHFSGVVDSVLSVKSDELAPYAAALREKVCASCGQQSIDGECRLRTSIDCGLDRYLPLITESIEKFRPEHNGTLTNFLRVQ